MATLVRHPNVAALYDFSRLPDGSYYMVWEFIDGVTLEEWMRRHRPAASVAGSGRLAAGPGGARRDPRAGDRAPGPLAGQHPRAGEPGGAARRQDHRPRHRQARGGRVARDDGDGPLPRQAQVLFAGAGGGAPRGESRGRAERPLFLRCRALRDARGAPAVRIADAGRLPGQAPPQRAAAARHERTSGGDGSGPGIHRHARAREEARAALLLRRRVRRRSAAPRTRFRRAHREARRRRRIVRGETGRLPLWIAAVFLAAAGTAAFYILNRPAAPRRPPSAVPTFPASVAPTAAPTTGPDEVVIAPRIIEQRTPTEAEPPRRLRYSVRRRRRPRIPAHESPIRRHAPPRPAIRATRRSRARSRRRS